jgi:hypothetical protein
MKTIAALAAVLAVVAMPLAANAATKHHRHHDRAGYGAYARSGGQIACTQYGCLPVRPGCHRESGRTLSGDPTGFDIMACPTGTLYGNR